MTTIEELTEWLQGAKVVKTTDYAYDTCGNRHYSTIVKRGRKLYAIAYTNGKPKLEPPREVVRKTRTIKETYYEYVKP